MVNAFVEDAQIEKVYSRAVESINEIARKLAEPAQFPLVPITEDKREASSGNAAAGRRNAATVPE